jgi:hypothetical protein
MYNNDYTPYDMLIMTQRRLDQLENNQAEIIRGLRMTQETQQAVMDSIIKLQKTLMKEVKDTQ